MGDDIFDCRHFGRSVWVWRNLTLLDRFWETDDLCLPGHLPGRPPPARGQFVFSRVTPEIPSSSNASTLEEKSWYRMGGLKEFPEYVILFGS